MKKTISLILALIITISFASCGKNKTNSDSDSIDIQYYAKIGKMPECSYSLGADVDKVKAELSKNAEDDPEGSIYNETEGEKTVLIDNGAFLFSYVKDKKDKGISYIVNYGKAYGFDNGTISVEVKETLSDYECTEETAGQDYAFFLNGLTDCSVLKYTFDNYTIAFVFEDDSLFATAIYDTDNWL